MYLTDLDKKQDKTYADYELELLQLANEIRLLKLENDFLKHRFRRIR